MGTHIQKAEPAQSIEEYFAQRYGARPHTENLPAARRLQSPCLQAALDYAHRGWLVIPLHTPTAQGCSCGRPDCASVGKHPRTRNGSKDASRDSDVICEWWNRWPDANVGIATGAQSGLLVLDVDGAQGESSLVALEKEHGALPDTFTVRTGSGGQHLYFIWPKGVDVRNSARKIAPGLDIRGVGGLVAAEPSLHKSGRRYEVSESATDPAPCPEWLLSLIQEPPAPAAAGQSAPAPVTSIQQGSRTPLITKLVGKLHSEGVPEAGILQAALALNQTFEPPLAESKVSKAVKDMCRRYEAGQQPQCKPEPAVWTPNIIQLSTVEAREVRWLAKPYIPLGMLSCMDGHPGSGKSFCAMKIASEGSRGRTLDGRIGEPWSTVYCTCENPKHEVTRPRFESMGADLTKIFLLEGQTSIVDGEEMTTAVTLASIPALDAAIGRTGCKLMVIDPYQSFCGSDIDMNQANQTRPLFDALAALAEKHCIAILIIRHLNKAGGTHAISRALGSIDASAAVRSVMLVGSLPDDPQARAVAHIKTNVGPFGATLGFTISDDGTFAWTGASDITAADMLLNPEPSKGDSSKVRAEEWLGEKLRAGSVDKEDVCAQAAAAGISYRTLQRAKSALRVQSRRAAFAGGSIWSLPENATGSEAVQ